MKKIIVLCFLTIAVVVFFIHNYSVRSSAIPYINIHRNESYGYGKEPYLKEVTLDAASPIRVAIGAMISPRRSFLYYQDLLDCISEGLGRPVRIVQRRTYKEVNELLEKGDLEAALICSGAYVELRDTPKGMASPTGRRIELLAVPVVDGKPYYYSYLIVNKDSSFGTLEDLKNKNFAFSDPLSNTGHLYPRYLLAKNGYSPERFFSKTIFTYSHDNSIQAVGKNISDGAAVDSLIWDYFKKTMPEFVAEAKIIHRSQPFGIPPVVVPADLDADLKRKLENCFLTIHETERGKEILEKLMIEKFIKADDSLYDSIREMKGTVFAR